MHTSLPAQDKLNLISNLNTLLVAGIPILEAVDSLKEEAKKNQKKILDELSQDLNQGKTIASTLAKYPDAFDPVTTNIIDASEKSGTLDTSLKDVVENIQKDIELSGKIKAALVYPIFVLAVFGGILTLILFFVIPRIASVFLRFRIDLPLPTKILIFTSQAVISYLPFIVVGILLVIGAFVFAYKKNKKAILNLFFKLPLLSTLARQIDITRFTRSMSLLLSSGIPITESLKLSEAVVTKKEIKKCIQEAQESVNSGKKLSEGLKISKGVISSAAIRITEAGERSGTLQKSMQQISNQYDANVTTTLKTLTTLLEPFMLLVIGVLVGGIMLAIIAPIYGLIGTISTR